jgi:hypothetical protein
MNRKGEALKKAKELQREALDVLHTSESQLSEE